MYSFIFQGLSTQFDTRAVHLVNLSENNKHKNVTGVDNESLAKTTLVSLCPEPLHQENMSVQ